MKLYYFHIAPNPTKVRLYLAEKAEAGTRIELEEIVVNLPKGEQRTDAHLARNPLGRLPVLELDDGGHLTESLAIIEYLEELYPDPPMIGSDPLERARVRELERTIDLGVLARVARIIHNTRSPLGRPPNESTARQERESLPEFLHYLDGRIGAGPFVMGDRPTIADCTLFAACRFAEFGQVELDPACTNVHRWYRDFRQRPSAQ